LIGTLSRDCYPTIKILEKGELKSSIGKLYGSTELCVEI
jgi:hypothetical protein